MFREADMRIQGPQIHQFNNVAPKPIPRSAFKRDFTRRTTFNPNYLVPMIVDEILPGDDIKIQMNALVRLSTPLKPIMDNLYLETFWFFVPNRILWQHWVNFQGEQANPGDSVAYTIPVLDRTKAPLSTTGFTNQSLYDYLGLPTLVTAGAGSQMAQISALFARAYNKIFNAWFRDENLDNAVVENTGDGPDDPAQTVLLARRKRKDYFASGLPWPQKGTAVTIPLGTVANVRTNNANILINQATGVDRGILGNTTNDILYVSGGNSTTNSNYRFGAQTGLEVDLSTATAASINALRQAALYQQILELDARAGTRYVESIYSKFGVVSPDFRLQRPELIGQGHSRINVYAIPQTAATGATGTPQGNLAAFGTAQIQGGHGCQYSATEHGILMGLLNVRADLTYQQGIPRMFTRSTRLDFYEPLQVGLGEQTIFNGEIYAQGTSADLDVFAYQERFAEYRYKNSEITGIFRSNDPLTLQIWHLSQQFGSLPVLNSSFITENMPIDRTLAVATSVSPAFLADMSFDYLHVRPMPVRSNPGISRF